jgi:transposase-like protein
MEIITGVERRRRWSAVEKLRIVAETEQPGAGIAEIARRYEISRGLLWNWRSLVRRGVLRPEPQAVFVPVQVISDPSTAERTKRAEPPAVTGSDAAGAESKIEIMLADGTSIRIGQDISLMTLRRVVTVLRG